MREHAKGVCFSYTLGGTEALGIQNVTQAVEPLDEDETSDVCLTYTSSNGVTQQRSVTIISDSGFYTLALRCRDATKTGTTAYEFRCWVKKEVLPSIRKTGRYHYPAQGAILQPGLATIPAETLPDPGIAAKPEEPASEKSVKAVTKPVAAKASQP